LAKRGRRSIEIKWQEFEALCAIQATLKEIATVFGCSKKTIERAVQKHYKQNFVSLWTEERQRGFISLRRQLWQGAMAGNVALLIFLAKQYLGMADQTVVRLPRQPAHGYQPDLSRLTDEQLDQLEVLIESAYGGQLPAASDGKLPAASDLPALTTGQTTATQEKEGPGATLGDAAPDPGGEVAPTPPPVRPTDQT